MKRSGPLRRLTPLRRVTPLTRDRQARTRPLRRPSMPKGVRAAVYARAGGRCDRCRTPVPADEWQAHHRMLRSRGGRDTLANLVALCLTCHEWVHAHPRHATLHGLMVASWEDPAALPVHLHGRTWAWPWDRWTPIEGE